MNDNNTRYYNSYIDSSKNCSTYYNDELLESEFVTNLDEQFTKNCLGQQNCTLTYDYT